MNTPCPECQTALTPSIMGHLCHGCGAVYSFEKMSSMKATSGPAIKSKKSSPEKKPASTSKSSPGSYLPKSATKKSGVKHHVKKFLVPEIAQLPKPVDESHLLANKTGGGKGTNNQTILATPSVSTVSEPEVPEPAQDLVDGNTADKTIASQVSATNTDSAPPTAAGSFDEYMAMIGEIDNKPSSSSVHQSISYAPVKKNIVPIIACVIVAIAGLALVVLLAFNI